MNHSITATRTYTEEQLTALANLKSCLNVVGQATLDGKQPCPEDWNNIARATKKLKDLGFSDADVKKHNQSWESQRLRENWPELFAKDENR